MKKEDFNLEDYNVEDTFEETLGAWDEVYLVCFTRDGGYYISEVHEGDYYLGGDGVPFVNDSNIGFDSVEEVEGYYKRDCIDFILFSEESDRDEFVENELE